MAVLTPYVCSLIDRHKKDFDSKPYTYYKYSQSEEKNYAGRSFSTNHSSFSAALGAYLSSVPVAEASVLSCTATGSSNHVKPTPRSVTSSIFTSLYSFELDFDSTHGPEEAPKV